MPTINEEIQDGIIRHMVFLERYKAGIVTEMVTLLNKADVDLFEQIHRRLIDIGRGYNLSALETRRLEELRQAIINTRQALFASIADKMADELQNFAVYESDFYAKSVSGAVSNAGVTVALNQPSLAQLKAVVTHQPFQGRLLKEWFDGLAVSDALRVNDVVRTGIVQGQTTDQIVRRIRGTRARGYRDGILEVSRRNMAGVVHTGIAHTTSRAKDELYAANADILVGVKWVSTLDGRTSPQCRSLDGKVFPVTEGPRPPMHFRCRSAVVPYLGESSIKGLRASATGAVPDDMTYEQWLKSQSPKVQDEILGKSKAKMFREGNMPLERFVDPDGKPYTLQELMKRDAEIFEDVFGGAPTGNATVRAAQEVEFKEYLGAKTYDRMKVGVADAMKASGVPNYGLSEAEKIAVHAYTTTDEYYSRLNTALRSGNAETIARVAPMANVLDNALEKLPAYKGTVFRVTDLPDTVKIVKGGVFKDNAFMSATTADLGTTFGANHRLIMLESTKGRNIRGFSAIPKEEEILFPRGTQFDIVDTRSSNGFIEVLLNETD